MDEWKTNQNYILQYQILTILIKYDPELITKEIRNYIIWTGSAILSFIIMNPCEISNVCKLCKGQTNTLYNRQCIDCIQFDFIGMIIL